MVFSMNACLLCPQCPKLCPFRVWEEMVYRLDQVSHQGDRKFEYVFLSRSAKRPTKRDTRLNRYTMDSMVKDVVDVGGLDVEDKKITNQSLRVTAMNVQELLGFSEDTAALRPGGLTKGPT